MLVSPGRALVRRIAPQGARSLRQRRTWFGFGRRVAGIQPGRSRPSPPVPESIVLPPYAETGDPGVQMPDADVLSEEQIARMRSTCQVAARVLALAGQAVRPGVTTLEIDDLVHAAIVEEGAYPSPLNYRSFPRSSCTSVNEIVCHGIPDDRPLEEGDIVSIDVSVFKDGVHGDTCRTFVAGGDDAVDESSAKLIRTTQAALQVGIEAAEPGGPVSAIGEAIEQLAVREGLGVVREFVGHGIGSRFHTKPQVYHFGMKSPERLIPGTCFTIEPMLTLGNPGVVLWSDGWTVATADLGRAAQFEHTLLVTEEGIEVLTTYPDA